MRKLGLFAGVAAALVGLYALFGFLVAPSLIRNALVQRAAQAGYELRVGRLATNPFALAAHADDVQLAARAGERIFSARRASIDLAGAASLWRRSWTIDRVQLEEPLLSALPRTGAPAGGGPRIGLVVRQVAIENGTLAVQGIPRLERVRLRARDVSTANENPFSVSAAFASGGSARSDGTLALAPLAVSGELHLEGAALAEAWRYLPTDAGRAPEGRLSGSLRYRYAQGKLALSSANVQATLASGGHLALRGALALAPLSGQLALEASGLPLALAQPWLAERTAVRIAAGVLDARGTLHLGSAARYEGAAAIREARVAGPQGELLAWQSLATTDLRLGLAPFSLHADEMVARAPRANVVIAADGRLNVASALAFGGGKAAAGASAPPARPEITVGRLRIEQGQLDFADHTLATPFATSVHDLAGALAGLSTAEDSPARIELNGRVGKYGEARVRGALEPVAPATRTNVELRLRNLALADFTPYAVKFAGYRIDSGRLSASLRYRVREGRLVGSNQLEFDRLKLGEKVERAGALDLPIDLAVSLLTDAQGRINLAIPVSGDLRDPQVDLGGLIAKALRNTLAKIASAPFRALASLFGGDAEADELKNVSFDAGSARLAPPEEEKLARIAEALAARPQLRLSVRAGYDPQADVQALKRDAVLRELAKRAGYNAAAGAGAPAGIDLRDAKIRRAAESLYLARVGTAYELGTLKPREPGYGQRLVGALAAKTDVPPQAASELAERRAQAVRDALAKAGIDPARIEVAAAVQAQAQSDGVPSALALEGRSD
jgi:outer membrane protein OmpA-like peptidoglycan-associated protein